MEIYKKWRIGRTIRRRICLGVLVSAGWAVWGTGLWTVAVHAALIRNEAEALKESARQSERTAAEEEERAEATEASEESDGADDISGDVSDEWGALETWEIADSLDLKAVEDNLLQMDLPQPFSFTDTVKKLLSGELPFRLSSLSAVAGNLFLGELRDQKSMALQILMIVFASAIFSNFVHVFDSSQIADISFYMIYMLTSVLLMRSFMEMNQIVTHTCQGIYSFMKVLLPSYLVTVVFCSGSVSALGFYEISLLAMNLLQVLILKIILPGVKFYLTVLLLNQISREDYFSRLAELVCMVIKWLLKTMIGVVVGLQAVQCLVAPAVDTLKSSAVHRLVKQIPGIGTALDAAAETVAGSAVVLKNAVGVAGILALLAICAIPLVKLMACIFIFRLLCALIQPVSDRRMVDGIGSISGAVMLLLQILAASLAVFVVSLAMITAAVRGG